MKIFRQYPSYLNMILFIVMFFLIGLIIYFFETEIMSNWINLSENYQTINIWNKAILIFIALVAIILKVRIMLKNKIYTCKTYTILFLEIGFIVFSTSYWIIQLVWK
ncbi:MAG: hypothetical protein JXL85_04075 [Bacilli bacterium]|nr:hypothetical protein [Bacilli bacterium]